MSDSEQEEEEGPRQQADSEQPRSHEAPSTRQQQQQQEQQARVTDQPAEAPIPVELLEQTQWDLRKRLEHTAGEIQVLRQQQQQQHPNRPASVPPPPHWPVHFDQALAQFRSLPHELGKIVLREKERERVQMKRRLREVEQELKRRHDLRVQGAAEHEHSFVRHEELWEEWREFTRRDDEDRDLNHQLLLLQSASSALSTARKCYPHYCRTLLRNPLIDTVIAHADVQSRLDCMASRKGMLNQKIAEVEFKLRMVIRV